MNRKLKIGIIINSVQLPAWIYRVIEKIACSDFSEINLVIFNTGKVEDDKRGRSLFYKLHLKTDRFISRHRIDFDKITDASGILRGISMIAGMKDDSDTSSLLEISRYKLDIIINFALKKPVRAKIPLSLYGIWNYQPEQQDKYQNPSNGYWELINKIPERMVVVKSTDPYSRYETILFRSSIPASFSSIHLNLDHAYNLGALFIPRIIKGICEQGSGYLNNLVARNASDTGKHNITTPSAPSNLLALRNMLKVYWRYVFNKALYLERQNWFIAFQKQDDPMINMHGKFTSLIPSGDRFWADPFVICKDKKNWVFIEELMFETNKGHISVLELDEQGKIMGVSKVLEKDYHMSYPFLFEYNHQYYMIPETAENRTVQLYQCEQFPNRWKFVMNLMENKAAMDTTVFFHNNRWWLFAAENKSSRFPEYLELFLYYSSDIFTANWTPHPANPIVSDIRNARPAGKIFIHNNKIYRPSQDCSGLYGKAYNVNQITNLSETSFEEVLILRKEADWDSRLKGTHTFNFDKDMLVVDAFTIEKRFHKAS